MDGAPRDVDPGPPASSRPEPEVDAERDHQHVRAGLRGVAEAAEVLATSSDLDLLLATTCRVARDVTGARYAALGVIGDHHRLDRFVHDGVDGVVAAQIGPPPTGGGVLGVLIRDPRTLCLEDVASHPASSGFPPHHPPMRTFLGTPVRAGGEVFGNLYLTDKEPGFTRADEQVAEVLAAQVGAAVVALRLRAQVEVSALQRDRERIARDLHDHSIQRLFATVMVLDGLTATVGGEANADLEHAVTQVQEVIRDLRHLTHDLHHREVGARDLRARLVDAGRVHEAATGVRPVVTLAGLPAADRLPVDLVDDLVAVVVEALSNAARHAGASAVEVSVEVRDGRLALSVADDGCGAPEGVVRLGRGLGNIRSRVTARDGTVGFDSEIGEGTTLRVEVPLPAHDDATG